MVAEKTLVIVEDEHAHDVEPDRAVGSIEVLGEPGRRQTLEGVAVEGFLGKSLTAVLTELAADEDQVVLFAGDEVDGVAAVRSPLFEDFETSELEIAPDALHRLGVDGFHGWPPKVSARPRGGPCGSRAVGVPGGCKGGSKTLKGPSFRALNSKATRKVFAALAPAGVLDEPAKVQGAAQGACRCPGGLEARSEHGAQRAEGAEGFHRRFGQHGRHGSIAEMGRARHRRAG